MARREVRGNHHPSIHPAKIEGNPVPAVKERRRNRLFLVEEVRIRVAALHLSSEDRECEESFLQRLIVREIPLERFELCIHLGFSVVPIEAGMQLFKRFAHDLRVQLQVCRFNSRSAC